MFELTSSDYPGNSRVLDAYEARRRLRHNVEQDLIDLGRSFQEEISDPAPQDWAEFLGKDLDLRLTRARVLIPDLNPVVPQMTLTSDQLQELKTPFGDVTVSMGLDLSDVPLDAIALMYPETAGNWTLQPENGMYKGRRSGYFLYEDVALALHTRTWDRTLIGPGGLEEQTGLRLMTPVAYHIASGSHFTRTGSCFDLNTYSRIRDPRNSNSTLTVMTLRNGSSDVLSGWMADKRGAHVGARLMLEI